MRDQSDADIDIPLLEGVLAGATSLIAGVPEGAGSGRTPCPAFDVTRLTDHLVGFMRRFESVLSGREPEDSAAYVAGSDPAAEYAKAAAGAVAALRSGDRPVELTSGLLPRSQVYCIMLLEYTVHGWDLARATGQSVPYTEEQISAALAGSPRVVLPEYRGEGRNFGTEVPVPPDTSSLDRLVAFTGRDPGWPR